MISRQEVLKIVAEKHNIIIADNDPILSVLAVSEAIYDAYTARLSAEIEKIMAGNAKLWSQRSSSMQASSIEALRKISEDNQRGLAIILENSKSDWQRAFSFAQEQNRSVIKEFRTIRTHIFIGLVVAASAMALMSFAIWTKGV